MKGFALALLFLTLAACDHPTAHGFSARHCATNHVRARGSVLKNFSNRSATFCRPLWLG